MRINTPAKKNRDNNNSAKSAVKWKKFTAEETDPLLDKVEQLQDRLR